MIEHIGVKAEWDKTTLRLDPRTLANADLPDHLVESLRGAVLLLSVLGPRSRNLTCAVPGGCPIGRRSFSMASLLNR